MQSSRLPTTGAPAGLWSGSPTPKEDGRMWGDWGGQEKWRLDRGGWEGRGVPTPGGTLRGSDQGGVGPAFPLPHWLGKSARFSGQVLRPQRSPPGWVGPGGVGGRLGEKDRQAGGALRTRGAGKEQRAFVPPTWAQGACWPPRPVPRPPKPPPGLMGPGGIRGRPGKSAEAGGKGPPGPEEQERSGGRLPHPLKPRKPVGVPGGGPPPSETRGRRHSWAPSALLSLSHTPHPTTAFPSPVGPKHRPTHCPNITPA